MPHYLSYMDFTAQGRSVEALLKMYNLHAQAQAIKMPLTPIVVFLAFSIESYLNSVGSRVIPFWDEIERMPWKSKVNVLHSAAKREPNWGHEPLAFASEVFRFRDKLAHGKPERVEKRTATAAEPQLLSDLLTPAWYAAINDEWIVKAKDRFRILMIYIGELHGFHESDHLAQGSGSVELHDGDVPPAK